MQVGRIVVLSVLSFVKRGNLQSVSTLAGFVHAVLSSVCSRPEERPTALALLELFKFSRSTYCDNAGEIYSSEGSIPWMLGMCKNMVLIPAQSP